MPLEDFLVEWKHAKKEFHEIPPVSGFIFFEGSDKKYHDISVELRKPEYDAAHDALKFNIFFLSGDFTEETIDEVTIFIDWQKADLSECVEKIK